MRVSPTGRPKGEHRSAQRAGSLFRVAALAAACTLATGNPMPRKSVQ
jgi:hypothetical protein